MFRIKDQLTKPAGLEFCCHFFIYSALFFSVLWHGSDQLWRTTVLQTLIFISFFFYGIQRQLSGKNIINPLFVNKPFMVLTFLVFYSSGFAQNKALSIDAMVQFLSCIAGFYIFIEMAKHQNEQVRLIIAVTVITIGLCIFGLFIQFEIFIFPSWEWIAAYQKGMLSATFVNHCHMAGWLEMVILLFIGLIFARSSSKHRLIISLFLLAIMMGTLFFTLSRGGWAAAVSGLLFVGSVVFFNSSFAFPKKYLIYASGMVLILLFLIMGSSTVIERSLTVLEQETNALSGRQIAWIGTIDMIKANPLTGVGPGNYATGFTKFQPPGISARFYKAHSDYLQFIAEMGLFFIPIMVWLVISFFKMGFKKLNHPSRQTRWITLGAMGGIVAILVHSISDFNLQIPSNALLFTLLAAQVAAPAPALKKTSG